MLTTSQQQTLKALALADPTASQYITNPSVENDALLAQWYNVSGSFVVWRTSVLVSEIYEKTTTASTAWDWTTYISSTTAPERDAWGEMTRSGALKPSLQNVRDGWAKIFSGTANAVVAQRAHLSAVSQRVGTRAEGALAAGVGTAANPGTLGFEGQISQSEASTIRSLP